MVKCFLGIVIDRETEVETIVKRDIKIEGEVDLDHETIKDTKKGTFVMIDVSKLPWINCSLHGFAIFLTFHHCLTENNGAILDNCILLAFSF